MPPGRVKRIIRKWKQRIQYSNPVLKTSFELRHGALLSRHRDTRIGKWLYRKALKKRAAMSMEGYEVVLPMEKLIFEFEELVERVSHTKKKSEIDAIRKRAISLTEEIRSEMRKKAVRRALYATNIPRSKWKNVWAQMKYHEGIVVRNGEEIDTRSAWLLRKRIRKLLGLKFNRFFKVYYKVLNESSDKMMQYIEHLFES